MCFLFLFFSRKSGAVQARTFHYHTRNALHETIPRKLKRGGRSAFIISLSRYFQNMLYFTFCSRENCTFSDTVALSSHCHPQSNVEHLRWRQDIYRPPARALDPRSDASRQGPSVIKMQIFISSNEVLANNQGPLFRSRISACTALFPGWKRAKKTLAEQIWLRS